MAQLFAWLRRQHRIDLNPSADLLMPRPDRRLPEATLSAQEMAALFGTPTSPQPLGLEIVPCSRSSTPVASAGAS